VLEQLIGGNEGIPSPLFKALISLPSEATKNRLVRLDYQHRMDAAIADFPSRVIYGGRSMLTNLKEPRAKFHIEERVVKREVRKTAPFDMSDPQGIRRISPTEAVLAMAEIAMISKWVQNVRPGKPPSVYVVAFYRNQRELLDRAFRRMMALDGSISLNVLFHTVDTCQGHEADIVILSFGRDSAGQRSSFMRSFNRVNVALTRAKSHLILTRLPPGNGSGDIVDRLHEELAAGRMAEGNHDVSPRDRCVIAVQEALKEMRTR
jgi:superfamily I DNA and/or RNA helicase